MSNGLSKKAFCLIFMLILLIVYSAPVFALSKDGLPDITADSAILVDAERGQILYGKASSTKIHVSAASKIMTAVIVLEKSKLDSKITISKVAASEKGSLMNLEAGAKYDVQDLLYAIILTTANDAASALADSVAGDSGKFVELMNQKAGELKMTNTLFKDPTGLNDDQYTTAYDFSTLVRYAISNPEFNRIFSTKAIPLNNESSTRILVNSNKLFWSYEGIDGGKTGVSQDNRISVVTTATRYGMRLISVVLKSLSDKAFEDSSQLLDYGFNGFKRDFLVKEGETLKSIDIGDKRINLTPKDSVFYIHPLGMDYIASLKFKIAENIKPPVTKETVLGTAEYTLNDNTKILVSLFSNVAIEPPETLTTTLLKRLTAHKEIVFVVLFLISLELILLFRKLSIHIKNKPTEKL